MKTDSGFQADSLCDFLTDVQDIHTSWEKKDNSWLDPWFRGISNADHTLLPGFYRPAVVQARKEYDLEEDDYRIEFDLKATPYLRDMRAGSQWEKYCLMQHYGLPTRLLDWSESALIALYFAVSTDMAKTNAAVWMLDPWWFNKVSINDDNLYFSWEKRTQKYLPPLYSDQKLPKKPMAIQMEYNSPRITAQRGLFTIHGEIEKGLEELVDVESKASRLIRIVIDQSRIPAVRRQLRTAGITATSIYPDLAGLCAELRQDWSDLPEITGGSTPETAMRRVPPRKSGKLTKR